MPEKNINVAIVGLSFGAEFIPIYQRYPDVELLAVCQRDEAGLNAVADRFAVPKRYTDFSELLADPDVDAVHINTPPFLHSEQSIACV